MIAAQLPGGKPLDSAYAPDFLTGGGGRLDIPADLPGLAVQALDRVMGDDSEWYELWQEASEPDQAYDVVRQLRATLSAAAPA